MENEEVPRTVVEISPKKKSRSAPRRKARAGRPRRSAARKRKSAARRSPRTGSSFGSLIRAITGGVTVARAAIAEASGQGTAAVRQALGTASSASKKTVTRLAKEWRAMDPKKKAGILAALLGAAAAAASAPIVRSRLKKR